MATGQEMAINALLKLCGVNTPELQAQVITGIKAILTAEARMTGLEADIAAIMAHMGIKRERVENGEKAIGYDGGTIQ